MMNSILKKNYIAELESFKNCKNRKEFDQAWYHLERAHIIGQMYWFEHLETHLLMAAFALKNFMFLEFFYQVPRILLSIPGSLLKKAPIGNVGTSRVGIFEPMEIPNDLKALFEKIKE